MDRFSKERKRETQQRPAVNSIEAEAKSFSDRESAFTTIVGGLVVDEKEKLSFMDGISPSGGSISYLHSVERNDYQTLVRDAVARDLYSPIFGIEESEPDSKHLG